MTKAKIKLGQGVGMGLVRSAISTISFVALIKFTLFDGNTSGDVSSENTAGHRELLENDMSHDNNEDYTFDYDDDTEDIIEGLARRKPSFIIIGVKKCGTGALREMLTLHTKIKGPNKKEVNYFGKYYKDRPVDWYLKQMPLTAPDELSFEKTPSYFIESKIARRIKRDVPDAKLLLIVREPVQRFVSDLLQYHTGSRSQEHRKPPLPLDQIFERVHHVSARHRLIRNGVYALHLKRWLRYFDFSQIHIVNGDNFVLRPWEELIKVENFLEVEHQLDESRFFFNATKGFYCFYEDGNSNTGNEKCMGDSKGRAHPQLPQKLGQKLVNFYAEENKKFFELIGEDFGWNESYKSDAKFHFRRR